MKQLRFLIIIWVLFMSVSCTPGKTLRKQTQAHIQFKESAHDFGTIIFGKPAQYDFEFKNIGFDTLVIYEVQSTCGCTVPKWSSNPVLPGEKGVVEVSYDTQRSGSFEKGITVFSNADNSALLLVIRGYVTSNPHKEILGNYKTKKQVVAEDDVYDASEEELENPLNKEE